MLMRLHLRWLKAALMGITLLAFPSAAARQMENLGRGLVAVAESGTNVFLSWRWLATDPNEVAFDVFRADGEKLIRLNTLPLTNSTCFVDSDAPVAERVRYVVRPVQNTNAGAETFVSTRASRRFLSVPLRTPRGYTPGDASVGDLDGDGEYEIVLHQVGRARDNSHTGLTDPPILQAYKLDGTFLWEINLGRNIREGAHYTQFMVYDLDGDGIAEIACKTADGTVDGRGSIIGDAQADWRELAPRSRTFGKILSGPEYLTIFDGRTGKALITTNYIPPRGDISAWGGVGGNAGTDETGNRVDRFLACIAYLEGERPSLVMCRGYYGRSVLAAWDWRDRRLTQRWVFDSKDGRNPFSGQGAHSVSVADVDADGRDEIIYHSMVVDDNGRGMFSTGLRHGDALHVSDFDPERPGLEVFGVHETEEAWRRFQTPGAALFDARTGVILWSAAPGVDIGRGLAADIDPRHAGAEMWGGPIGLRSAKGDIIGRSPRATSFAVWWDADPQRELLHGTSVLKWDWRARAERTLLVAEGCAVNNGSKGNPVLSADLFGDWREEVIWRSSDNRELRIYTTTVLATNRLRTLMHDSQYRLAVAWQNVGYNQPPHPSFFLGSRMAEPPRRGIRVMRQQ
jgi:rhamnogalacturonan endolyase